MLDTPQDIRPLAACTALRLLCCADMTHLCSLEGVPPSLEELYCSRTAVPELTPLSACTALRRLDCSGACVPSLKPLSGCTALTRLDCSMSGKLNSLAGLPRCVTHLVCCGTWLGSLAALWEHAALQELDISCCPWLRDLTPLSSCRWVAAVGAC